MSAIKQIGILLALLLVTALRTTAPAQGVSGLIYARYQLHQSPDKAKTGVDIASDSTSVEEDQETSDETLNLFADCLALESFSFTSVFQLTEAEPSLTPISRVGANRPFYLLFHSLRIPSR